MHKTKNESFCSRRCRSMKHAEEIFSAILRGNEEQAIAFMCWRCSNYGRVADEVGRTALHIASSCGKTKVVEWILKNSDFEAFLNAKDNESGYTPLHRSLFHGHLGAARCLIKHGAKMNALDNDGLMPLDHLMKDSPPMPKPFLSAPSEVYVWGSNSNFNLGIGNQQIRRFPDTVDYFRKNNISIKNVAMGKFHSIFVSNDGRAFSCGHGQGGRLGLDSEETVMTPNQIFLSPHHNGSRFKDAKCVVVCASVGQDHSMILTEKGIVYTFGMNDHYQLGHDPPPSLLLSPKALPNVFSGAVGVQAAHYHSVAWSQSQVFTWGLNCGQLGHPKADGRQIKPKAVSSFGEVKLVTVAVGDGATVIASAQGEIFILQDYCCRKIGYCMGVSRMEVSGGRLDPALIKSEDISGWGDYRNGEDDLKVMFVIEKKKILVWQSSTGHFVKCNLRVGNRRVTAVDASLGMNKLLVVTDEGEGFEAEFKIKKKFEDVHLSNSSGLVGLDVSLDFNLKRIGYVHRAISVFCDPKGSNFSVIQLHPNYLTKKPESENILSIENSLLSLLEEAEEDDFLSDVVFCVGNTRIPAHRYIVESNCKYLASLINSADKSQQSLQSQNIEEDPSGLKSQKIVTVVLEDMHPYIFKELLKYIYTGMTDLWNPDHWSAVKDLAYSSYNTVEKEVNQRNIIGGCSDSPVKNSNKDKLSSKSCSVKSKPGNNKTKLESNPVNDIRKAALRLGLNELAKLMDGLQYNKSKSMIVRKTSSSDVPDEKLSANIPLNPHNCSHLHDVVLECNEGRLINVHKCILSMRSKYFDIMLKGNWLECSGQRNLTLPFPYEVMETILLYLYQDKVPILKKTEDFSFLCHVLIAADHILLEGLKEICETSLANHATLKNITELYQLSDTYNASKLKSFCMNYICHNLSALLESRALDCISSELFDNLQMCYWGMRPIVLKRHIDPPNKYPDLILLQSIWETIGVPSEEEHFKQSEHSCKSPTKVIDSSKRNRSKKKQRSKQSSLDENVESLSRLSLGSTPGSDFEMSSERFEPTFSSFDMDTSETFEEDGPEKDGDQFSLDLKLEESLSSPIRITASFDLESKSASKITSVNEEEFPLLTGDVQPTSLSIQTKVPKQRRITKLSQKARKKLLTSPGITDEPIESPQDTWKPELNVWKKANNTDEEMTLSTIQSLSQIMSEEKMHRPKNKRCYQEEFSEENKFFHLSTTNSEHPLNSNMGKSSHWSNRQPLNECQITGQKPFNEIIADELKQREITKKIMEKPLHLTQIEDRAIREIQLMYEKEFEFEQRITVKRHCSAQASKPVWISSKNM